MRFIIMLYKNTTFTEVFYYVLNKTDMIMIDNCKELWGHCDL